jgi:hypothetical protein
MRGAVDGCGGSVVALGRQIGVQDPPGLIVRFATDGNVADTLAVLGPLRRHAQLPNAKRASFMLSAASTILAYTEEEERHRILELACDGSIARELQTPSIGTGEQMRPTDDGRMEVRPPQPPFPAGLIRFGDRVLWATQVIDTLGRNRRDSLTVVTSFGRNGHTRTLLMRGWFELFDANNSKVLIGNLHGAYPSVIAIGASALGRLIDGTAGAQGK